MYIKKTFCFIVYYLLIGYTAYLFALYIDVYKFI